MTRRSSIPLFLSWLYLSSGEDLLSLAKTSGYAILALGCLQESADRFVLAKDIAKCTGVPKPYLAKILNSLVEHNLVTTKRGRTGGFGLARPASQISVLEIAEAVEGASWNSQCILGLPPCSARRKCPLHAFWIKQLTAMRKKLQSITVADAAKFERLSRSQLRSCPPKSRVKELPKTDPRFVSDSCTVNPNEVVSQAKSMKSRRAKP